MSAEQEVVETTPAAQRNGHVVKLERLIAQGKTNDEIVEVMGKDKVHASLIAKVRKRLEDANAADGVIEPPATKRGRGQRGRDKTSQLIDRISVSGEVLKPAAKRYGKSTLPKVEKDEKFPILEVPINDLNCIVIDAVVSLDPERVLQYRELWKIYDKGELAWNKPMKAVEMEGGELFLAGGRHRIQAAVDNGRKTVPIEIRPGDMNVLRTLIARDNNDNGRTLSKGEQRSLLRMLLEMAEYKGASNRILGLLTGLHHTTVGTLKNQIAGKPSHQPEPAEPEDDGEEVEDGAEPEEPKETAAEKKEREWEEFAAGVPLLAEGALPEKQQKAARADFRIWWELNRTPDGLLNPVKKSQVVARNPENAVGPYAYVFGKAFFARSPVQAKVCVKCEGTGKDNKERCGNCQASGYVVPGLLGN